MKIATPISLPYRASFQSVLLQRKGIMLTGPREETFFNILLKMMQEGEQKYLLQWPQQFRQGNGWGIL